MFKPRPNPATPVISYAANPIPAPKPLGLLAWIAVYKLIKAVIAIMGALLVFHLGGMNLVQVGHHWLLKIGLDPEGKFGTSLLRNLSHVNPSRVYGTMALFLGYAVLYCVEAVGLAREKRWAEWLTVFQTGILVPIEVYEMLLRPGPFKAGALCLSVGVILYLIWRIRRDESEEAGQIPRDQSQPSGPALK